MSITIENAEAEAILADLAARTRRPSSDLLLDLLRRERIRVEGDRERRIADGLAADEALRRLNAAPVLDPRPVEDLLAYDDHGLPV